MGLQKISGDFHIQSVESQRTSKQEWHLKLDCKIKLKLPGSTEPPGIVGAKVMNAVMGNNFFLKNI